MRRKECPEEDSRKESATQAAVSNSVCDTKRTPQPSSAQAKMPPKDSKISRPAQGQVRKRRILPKALPIEGMREAAQLARSYIRAIETQNQENQRQASDVFASRVMAIPYEHLLQYPGSMVNAHSKPFPQDLSLMNQLHANGTVPAHLLCAGAMTVNKRPFLANAAEESRLKRLRKIVNSTTLETLGHQAAIAKYGGNHSSPLLPSPAAAYSVLDLRHEDPNFHFHQKPLSAHYSSEPPSPTPRKASTMSKLSPDMRLDSSAFPTSKNLESSGGFCSSEAKQMSKCSQVPSLPKSSSESHRNSILQPPFNLGFAQFDGFRSGISLHPQNSNLNAVRLETRSHSLPSHYNGILPLPGSAELNGNGNNMNALAYMHQDAGILPLPGRAELAQIASLQQGIAAHAFGSSQYALGQALQLQSLPMQGDVASLQHELSGQRYSGGQQPLYQSPQMQNHLQYLTQDHSAQRSLGNHHQLLPPLTFQTDLATLQQDLAAQQYNAGHQPFVLQGDYNALQQELCAQRMQNSLMHPLPLQTDLASFQHEILTQRLHAGQLQCLQSYPIHGNLALLQQDIAAHGLSGGHHPYLQSLPAHGELSALQQELDYQRLNGGTHPLVQASLQQLSAQNYNGGQHPLLQTLPM
ncbi:hypothetical protein Mp_5g09320 [Marchantia polymorpha subsp. ruderalis]|uniref:Uncharacterized protein n=2 Tax=Marchantia polymorpha TaxID=3197 RepID=A0AAF6BGJ8_MARPO|nr:hypothetical protein MARPO_0095s0028 [Marchantia polymorpha]BBN11132.1 hypothetical protein Mp_5g09320 [Marchantia polymorpha subsp. ruderalis]|eukprot:PTQ32766.1 hypothetical protein MARPO_0095s0028 [Marchantia polymorpha]